MTSAGKKKKKLSYEDKVRNEMENYNKAHPERKAKDNYTISLRKQARREEEKAQKMVLTMFIPVAGPAISIGSALVYQKRANTLASIMDEYNIEEGKRVLNM